MSDPNVAAGFSLASYDFDPAITTITRGLQDQTNAGLIVNDSGEIGASANCALVRCQAEARRYES